MVLKPLKELTLKGPDRKQIFHKSDLGRKILFSILFFSTIITLFLTSIQIYIDYKKGINGIYTTVEQIKATQLESLAQNLWNINNEQIQIQLKGLLEIETIKGLRIIPLDDQPISIVKGEKTKNDILNTYPIFYERKGQKNHLGNLEIISDISPVIEELKSRILIILLTQGTKTFLVSSFILLIFNVLVNKHLFKIKEFAGVIGLENPAEKLELTRAPTESKDELDDLADSLNTLQQKILREAQEKKNFQEQLLQSQKMEALGTLASGIAHDFNNILQGLYNALFILEEEVIDNADALQKLGTAGDLVDRARELVKQILIYTKQQEGSFSKFGAIGPIQDVVNILRAAKPKNVSIDLFIDPPKGKLYGDETQLKQILLNLGNNAIHAIEDNPNGTIKIKLTSRNFGDYNAFNLPGGPYLELIVEDNGMGMKDEIKQRIFEPFFSTKDIDQGTGLGLSVVLGIVHRHKGEITVDSIEGKGSKFTIFLPLLLNRNKNVNPTIDSDKVILVTSDEDLKTKLLSNNDLAPLIVGHYASAQSTLKTIKEVSDLKGTLIIDSHVNDFGPEELIRKIRQFNDDIPIIFLSENASLLPLNLRTAVINRSHFITEIIPTSENVASLKHMKNSLNIARDLVC